MNNTLVIVPTYNERENLPAMAERLARLAVPVDLLVVDGNSPDGTGQIADELAAKNPAVHVLHETEKNGLGRAYCAGFAWALKRSTNSSWKWTAIFPTIRTTSRGSSRRPASADLVLGSRYCNGIRVINWPMRRLLLSTGAALLRPHHHRHAVYRSDRRVQMFPPPRLAIDQPRCHSLQRLQLPNRDDAQNLACKG